MHEHPGLKPGIGQVVEQEVVGQDGRNAQKKVEALYGGE